MNFQRLFMSLTNRRMYTESIVRVIQATRLEIRISRNMTQTSTRAVIPRWRNVAKSFISLSDYNYVTAAILQDLAASNIDLGQENVV